MNSDKSSLFGILFLAILIVSLVIWCSTGTMALYAATHHQPTILDPCKYLVNLDHGNFVGTFLMIDGAPQAHWEWSVVLRRVLYPIVAYPFMKLMGYMVGGVFTTWLLHLAALVALTAHCFKLYGKGPAFIAALLFATYPGVAYWSGLPYSYAAIVPVSVFCYLLLTQLNHANSWRRTLLINLALGTLFLAYDLLPFFGIASLGILFLRRKWLHIIPAAILLVLPSLIVTFWMQFRYQLSFNNGNTNAYSAIIGSYLNPPSWEIWKPLITEAPTVFVQNYLYSNFFVLPVFFAFLIVLQILRFQRLQLGRAETCILLAALFIFLFNNLAPPYPGWQLRGEWIARLYQPVFIVMMMYAVKIYAHNQTGIFFKGIYSVGILCVIALNAALSFGPILKLDLADKAYYEFYRHSHRGALMKNLEIYGRRPLGYCRKN